MLRVGLTGGLGSGKSTAARMFAEHGAHVLSADELGRQMMQPGQAVYAEIVGHFGPAVVAADATLDRSALARIAFEDGRVEEINAIVHPATIARQAELVEEIAGRDADAIVIIESALIFDTKHGGEDLRNRFEKTVLVVAPEAVKIARFVERTWRGGPIKKGERAVLEAEARRRLARQMPDEEKSLLCDYILANGGSLAWLQEQVDSLWLELKAVNGHA